MRPRDCLRRKPRGSLSRSHPLGVASGIAPHPTPFFFTRKHGCPIRTAEGKPKENDTMSNGPLPLRKPLYPTIMSPPVQLQGGQIVNGELILDESPEAWKEFLRREPRDIQPTLIEDWRKPVEDSSKSLLDPIMKAVPNVLYNLLDFVHSDAFGDTASEDESFFHNYINNYYAGKGVASEANVNNAKANAKKKLNKLRGGSLSIPPIAQHAIDTAVDIFGTDYGKDGKARKKRYGVDRLRADLERVGAIESNYEHLKNLGGGSDSGYWQVQPSTAKDSLENAPDHFGEKFDEEFAPHGWSYDELMQMTEDELQALMRVKKEENQALNASFAAVKILQTFDY